MAFQFLLVLIAIIVPILSIIYLKKGKQGDLRLPPSPPKFPFIGHLHLLSNLPHQSLQKLSQKYGPIILLKFGSVPTLIVSSAETAKEVTKDHDLQCCSRPPLPGTKRLSYDYVDIAFAPYSEYWRQMRKLLIAELLSKSRVVSFAYAREAQVESLIDSLTNSSSTVVILNEKLFALADGIIGTVAFGNIYGTDQFKSKELQHILDEAMDMLGGFSAEDFWPSTFGRMVDKFSGMVARREKCFKDLDTFFEMILDRHLDPARVVEPKENLVDVLIRLWREQDSLTLTKDNLKAMLFDTFLGGIDTSSITMLWAMSELIRDPRAMKKVQDEVRSVVGENKERVAVDDITKLTYLKMVVKETFRLHPPAPLLLPRETSCHVKIGGFDVPPKTRMFINAWAIGRDPKSWENPDSFYPERFEGKDIDFKGKHFELIPFGAGRRKCPGLEMGATNVEFTLANMLYCFNWKLPDGMEIKDVSMEEEGGITVHRKTPLKLVPVEYSTQE
ncbi:hypothetical protein LUZ60_016437 [Juncus effusus]|nr:hypothetical protein LUZ60_016437 [Juncus effusus]